MSGEELSTKVQPVAWEIGIRAIKYGFVVSIDMILSRRWADVESNGMVWYGGYHTEVMKSVTKKKKNFFVPSVRHPTEFHPTLKGRSTTPALFFPWRRIHYFVSTRLTFDDLK